MEENTNTTNIKEIEKSLETISKKREVEDLHPHLRQLFIKIPNVECEYTHGTKEYGADFILTSKNPMGSVDYIGVIVKNSGIKASGKIDEVMRQIEECAKIERLVENGKHKVSMNQVWVIANGNISNNAKERIHAERALGIVFYGHKELANLMDKHKYQMDGEINTAIAVCLSKQMALSEKLQNASLGSFMQFDNKFIDQKIRKTIPRKYDPSKKKIKKTKIPITSIEKAAEDNHTLVIYGEPASGKSSILQKLLRHYSSNSQYKKTKSVPIYAAAKDILDNYKGEIVNLISDYKNDHNLNDVDASYVLIIDGMDECGATRSERIEKIKEWKKAVYPKIVSKIIFSSRDYMEKEEINNISIYEIAELSMNEIVGVIRERLKSLDVVDKIVEDVVKSDIFRSLPSNPLAITILISLLKNEQGKHELPANIPDLFAKYSEYSLGRWDANVNEGEKQRKYEATNAILAKIAEYMIKNKLYQINEDEARKYFSDYLGQRMLRLNPNQLFDYIINRSDLLISNDGIFKFRHKTICEFFSAKSFSNKKIEEIGENIFDVQWVTILYFYAGAQKDCQDLIEKISNIIPEHESGKLMKFINMANILLASYLTNYEYTEKTLQKLFIETSEYINGVINRCYPESALAKLPVMQVLFFIRFIADYEYSRPFFKNAIENNLIKLEDMDMADDVKATSLFLMNIVHRTLEGEDIFTSMIKKMDKKIPIHIRLAINHETDFVESTSNDVKKYKRTIKRSLIKSGIGPLYDKKIIDLPKLTSK